MGVPRTCTKREPERDQLVRHPRNQIAGVPKTSACSTFTSSTPTAPRGETMECVSGIDLMKACARGARSDGLHADGSDQETDVTAFRFAFRSRPRCDHVDVHVRVSFPFAFRSRSP